jgi:hypothetical protein
VSGGLPPVRPRLVRAASIDVAVFDDFQNDVAVVVAPSEHLAGCEQPRVAPVWAAGRGGEVVPDFCLGSVDESSAGHEFDRDEPVGQLVGLGNGVLVLTQTLKRYVAQLI